MRRKLVSPGDPFHEDELFRWVEAQSAFGPRRPGSAAGRANEDFIFSKLKDFGLSDVRREPIAVTHWDIEGQSLTVAGRQIESFGIPYTALTSPEGVRATLVHARSNDFRGSDRWRGRIVVAEVGFPPINASLLRKIALGEYDPHDALQEVAHPATWIRLGWHLYRLAVKRGAVGFVGILKDQPGGSCRMYAPYGFKEANILDKPLPGLWVGRSDGEALLAHARAGASACLVMTGKHSPATTHNVIGEIPGRDDEALVLSTHHDSPFTSPVEDASGVAVVLALARFLATLPTLRRRIIVLFSAGHFYGSIGTRRFIQDHRADVLPKTALEISIEHIALEAVEDAKGGLVASGRPEPAGIFVPFNRTVCETVLRGLATHELTSSLLLPCEGPLGEYPPTDGGDWYEAGVPVINYISNPVYLLTDDDALRWVDKKRLSSVARFFADTIQALDAVPRARLRQVDFPVRLRAMKALKHLVRAKTTLFGLKPVH